MLRWAGGDIPQALSVLLRCLEGLPQAPEDVQLVLECRELARPQSLAMGCIGKHGFPCGLQHPFSGRLESTFLSRLPAGPADQALEGGLRPNQLPQPSQMCVGPALPPRSPWAWAWAWTCTLGRVVESLGQAAAVGPGESS